MMSWTLSFTDSQRLTWTESEAWRGHAHAHAWHAHAWHACAWRVRVHCACVCSFSEAGLGLVE